MQTILDLDALLTGAALIGLDRQLAEAEKNNAPPVTRQHLIEQIDSVARHLISTRGDAKPC